MSWGRKNHGMATDQVACGLPGRCTLGDLQGEKCRPMTWKSVTNNLFAGTLHSLRLHSQVEDLCTQVGWFQASGKDRSPSPAPARHTSPDLQSQLHSSLSRLPLLPHNTKLRQVDCIAEINIVSSVWAGLLVTSTTPTLLLTKVEPPGLRDLAA